MIEFESQFIDEESLEINLADADAFHKRALAYMKLEQRASLVFNIAAVALERYLVAICNLYGAEPRNHNYITLMHDIEQFVEVPPDVNRKIKAMDWIFGICSIDEYRHPNPDKTDMENVLTLCKEVQNLFDRERMAKILELAGLESHEIVH